MEKFKIKGIDHPAVAAENGEKLANWYCDVLGYELLFVDPRPIWLLKAQDGTILEILPIDETQRPFRTNLTPSWSHLAFKVDDIEAAITHLDAHQIKWSSVLSPATGGGRVRTFFDPENNVLQLVERPR
ncbi:VOC family protein [Telluribacter sp.]|jgi:glyoxylase I family protein|uniref:VOC family protein n=1 Tax=Telluribacter sp. TaxID=1978767 RepID=UPI002E0D285D|nr:VOC family protein [Telluribacter sp.]